MPPTLAIIAPCYNEEEVLPSSAEILLLTLSRLCSEGKVSSSSHIIFVDDGSGDSTWDVIRSLASPQVKGLRLSRHSGHQLALMAGMEESLGEADVCITIDADLQDDVDAIPLMLEKFGEGADIVFGVRENRSDDSWFKKTSADIFYGTMRGLGAACVSNHADFRLMSSGAVARLMEYGERNLFLRGIVPLLGHRQDVVYYKRRPRMAGRSKYPLKKMLDFAADGITSFSVRPVRMLFWIGLAFMLTAIGIFTYVLIRHFSDETIRGWSSLILSIWFCTGILLMGLGVIGEYIGKIYIEVKRRPRYHISERI